MALRGSLLCRPPVDCLPSSVSGSPPSCRLPLAGVSSSSVVAIEPNTVRSSSSCFICSCSRCFSSRYRMRPPLGSNNGRYASISCRASGDHMLRSKVNLYDDCMTVLMTRSSRCGSFAGGCCLGVGAAIGDCCSGFSDDWAEPSVVGN